MESNKKELNYTVANDRNIGVYKFIVFIVSVLIIFILFVWTGAEIGPQLGPGNALIIFLVLLGTLIILFSKLAMIPIYIFNNLWNKIIGIDNTLSKKVRYIGNLNELLDLITIIYNLMRKILFLKKIFLFFLTQKTNKKSKRYFQLVQENIMKILKDLQTQVKIQMNIQEGKLKQAKYEVEKNLKGTSELLRVSEAQKLKIDRQIEQFEELQKRLISL